MAHVGRVLYGTELGSVTLKINDQQRESHVCGDRLYRSFSSGESHPCNPANLGRSSRQEGGFWRGARDRRWRQSAACGEGARLHARCCGSGAAGIGRLALRFLPAASGAANLLAMGSPRTDACAQARARTHARTRTHTHALPHPRTPAPSHPPHPCLHHGHTHLTNTAKNAHNRGDNSRTYLHNYAP